MSNGIYNRYAIFMRRVLLEASTYFAWNESDTQQLVTDALASVGKLSELDPDFEVVAVEDISKLRMCRVELEHAKEDYAEGRTFNSHPDEARRRALQCIKFVKGYVEDALNHINNKGV
jgi:hypothetical protein